MNSIQRPQFRVLRAFRFFQMCTSGASGPHGTGGKQGGDGSRQSGDGSKQGGDGPKLVDGPTIEEDISRPMYENQKHIDSDSRRIQNGQSFSNGPHITKYPSKVMPNLPNVNDGTAVLVETGGIFGKSQDPPAPGPIDSIGIIKSDGFKPPDRFSDGIKMYFESALDFHRMQVKIHKTAMKRIKKIIKKSK